MSSIMSTIPSESMKRAIIRRLDTKPLSAWEKFEKFSQKFEKDSQREVSRNLEKSQRSFEKSLSEEKNLKLLKRSGIPQRHAGVEGQNRKFNELCLSSSIFFVSSFVSCFHRKVCQRKSDRSVLRTVKSVFFRISSFLVAANEKIVI